MTRGFQNKHDNPIGLLGLYKIKGENELLRFLEWLRFTLNMIWNNIHSEKHYINEWKVSSQVLCVLHFIVGRT